MQTIRKVNMCFSFTYLYSACVLTYFFSLHTEDLEEEKESPPESDLTEKQKHQLRHRELFLSRQYESLPATHIR